MAPGLRHFISANEVPPALTGWRAGLKNTENIGLAMRWVAAQEEMEPYLEIDAGMREEAEEAWNSGVIELLSQHVGVLEHMENLDCPTIVSVRLRRKTGRYLNVSQSKKVFEWMTLDMSDKLDQEVARRPCYIGQPVSLTADECVVRIAAGSDTIRSASLSKPPEPMHLS
jgi:hypothetical protein